MPRGNGLIYDYPLLREAILEFLFGLEMGDIYDGRDLVTHLTTYRGLSRKDKNKVYAFKERVLVRSQAFFVQVANRIIEKEDLPIVKKRWTKKFENEETVLGHESRYAIGTGNRSMYLHIGD